MIYTLEQTALANGSPDWSIGQVKVPTNRVEDWVYSILAYACSYLYLLPLLLAVVAFILNFETDDVRVGNFSKTNLVTLTFGEYVLKKKDSSKLVICDMSTYYFLGGPALMVYFRIGDFKKTLKCDYMYIHISFYLWFFSFLDQRVFRKTLKWEEWGYLC